MKDSLQHIASAARTLGKSAGFTMAVVLIMAVGIGGNTAMFSVTSALLLRPVPYDHPHRLVFLSTSERGHEEELGSFSLDRFELIRDHNRSFASVAAFCSDTFVLTGRGDAQSLAAARVSPNLLEVLGIRPEMGRSFSPGDAEPAARPVVMISDSMWRSSFGARSDIIGQTLELDGQPFTVLGVIPAGFKFPFLGAVDVWSPRFFELNLLKPAQIRAGAGYLQAVARLRGSATLATANADMEILNHDYQRQFPQAADANPGVSVLTGKLQEVIVRGIRRAVLVLTVATAVVLLIACANVAGLLLSRSVGRRKEMAVRMALGATRWHIVRQLLTESMLLGVLAGILALCLSTWATASLFRVSQSYIPQAFTFEVDWRVLSFLTLISVLCGVLFGIFPALETVAINPNLALREQGPTATGAPRRVQLRSILVVAQLALSMVLLICTGLLLRSFARLTDVDPGFDSHNVLTMSLSVPTTKHPPGPRQSAFFDELIRRVSALPGVTQVALSGALPTKPTRMSPALPEGQAQVPLAQRPLLIIESISPTWFRTIGTPIVAGREFGPADNAQSPEVIIVNQTLARRYWPGGNAVGKHVLIGRQSQPAQIVGVAADVRNNGLGTAPAPQLYITYSQLPWSNMNLLVRTAVDPQTLISSVRQQIAALDPDQPVTNVETLDELLDSSRAQPRLMMLLLVAFSTMALGLAGIGIYGLLAYTVAQRRHELGVRLALGARPADIMRLVLGKGILLAAVGCTLGVLAALTLTRLMSSVLFGTSTRDLKTFALTPVVLFILALLASYIPARRALDADCVRL